MRRFRPFHALLLVGLVMLTVLVVDAALRGDLTRGDRFQRVGPDDGGEVRLEVGDLGPGEVRFYRFLNYGNQEVRFFVGRDGDGTVHAAFDANELCFKQKRGYEHQDGWLVCRKCDKAFRLADVNAGGGGCQPVPVEHRLEGDTVVLTEPAILRGWRYFR